MSYIRRLTTVMTRGEGISPGGKRKGGGQRQGPMDRAGTRTRRGKEVTELGHRLSGGPMEWRMLEKRTLSVVDLGRTARRV